jgi:hypothetical protein
VNWNAARTGGTAITTVSSSSAPALINQAVRFGTRTIRSRPRRSERLVKIRPM